MRIKRIILYISLILISLCAYFLSRLITSSDKSADQTVSDEYSSEDDISRLMSTYVTDGEALTEISLSSLGIPSYNDAIYFEVNNNLPLFPEEVYTSESTADAFEYYSDLDYLGRCGAAYANICTELMPTEEREEIGHIKPSGWHTVKYPDLIEDVYLYNRCHLIAFMLAGENANEKNLITGTRYFNVEGMLPFENEVSEYVHKTGNHVLYRVTPVFTGNNPVADGVLMEAYSVEDSGAGVCFSVFVYNVQPGIEIDYSTGESKRAVQ